MVFKYFKLAQGPTYMLCTAVMLGAIAGMYAFGNKKQGRNVFDVTPPQFASKVIDKELEYKHKMRLEVDHQREKLEKGVLKEVAKQLDPETDIGEPSKK